MKRFLIQTGKIIAMPFLAIVLALAVGIVHLWYGVLVPLYRWVYDE